MLDRLDGYKTYIVAAVAVLWAVTGAVLGYLDPVEALNVSLAALGAAGLRDAIR